MLSFSSRRSRFLWLFVWVSLLLALASGQTHLYAQDALGSPGSPSPVQQDPSAPPKEVDTPAPQSDGPQFSPPSNDAFANAVVINTLPYTATQSTLEATDEAGQLGCGTNSVWYRYTPLNTGLVTITTAGSDFDTQLGVYTGTLNAFALIACNDDVTVVGRRSLVQFNAVAGTPYTIMVTGFGGARGNLTLKARAGAAGSVLEFIDLVGIQVRPDGYAFNSWTDTGAATYDIYIVNTATLGSPHYFNWNVARAGICGANFSCGITLPAQLSNLYNGNYLMWVRPGNGAWVGPNAFTINAPPPTPVGTPTLTGLNTLRPTVTFAPSIYTTAYNIVVWPATTFPNNPVYSGWQYRSTICPALCVFTLPVNLADNTSYVVGVQGYGYGGYSVGGLYSGWAGENFAVDLIANPVLPTNLSVNINNGQPTLTWTGSSDASRHYVSIYSWTTNAWVYGAYHNTVGDPALICAANICNLTTDAMVLPNGQYSFYVNSEGAGGASVGGTFSNGFAGPVDGVNTGEAGDFGFNLPVPGLASAIIANTFSTTVSFNFTGDPHATRYNIWIGTAGGAQTYYYNSSSALSLTCHIDQTCVGQVTLAAAIPSGTQYYVAFQGSGPGGILTTGGNVGNGFAVSGAFVAP